MPKTLRLNIPVLLPHAPDVPPKAREAQSFASITTPTSCRWLRSVAVRVRPEPRSVSVSGISSGEWRVSATPGTPARSRPRSAKKPA